MRFGLLTQWYDPEPGPAALPGALARGLRDAGHDVSVLTGFPNYPTGELFPGFTQRRGYVELEDGIEVHRAPLYVNHDERSLHRVANYFSFGLSSLTVAKRFFRDLDAVWVNYSPITVALPLWRGQFQFGTPAVVEVGDLWPDTVFVSDMVPNNAGSRIARGLLSYWCDALYRSAESVVYISPGVRDILLRRGVQEEKLAYVPKWANETPAPATKASSQIRHELGIKPNAKMLLYAGALGGPQGLTTLVEACAHVDDPRFILVIAGSGTAEPQLRRLAGTSRRDNIKFIGRLPQSRMPELMAAADFCYVGLAHNPLSSITMPSKTQAILAASKPILAAVEGDVAELVAGHRLGEVADPASSASIAAAIRRFCDLPSEELVATGRRAGEVYQRQFSYRRGVESIETLLVRASAKKGRAYGRD